MTSISIRPAQPGDAGTLAKFNALMARETEHRELDAGLLLKGTRALLADPSKGIYYVTEVDGKIVGQLMITYEWSDWRNGNFWWIQSVYVDPAFRSKGVFTALYHHIEALARSRSDVCGLRLYVEEQNTRAQKNYTRLGMCETSYKIMETDFVLR